jgi:hypothetical protein
LSNSFHNKRRPKEASKWHIRLLQRNGKLATSMRKNSDGAKAKTVIATDGVLLPVDFGENTWQKGSG